MNRHFKSALSLTCALWLVAAPLASARAEVSLSPAIIAKLQTASAQGPHQLLLSVYNQTLAHPELAQQIARQAKVFQPGLSNQIATTVSQAQGAAATGATAPALNVTVVPRGLSRAPAQSGTTATGAGAAQSGVTIISHGAPVKSGTWWVLGGVLAAGAAGAGLAVALAAEDSGSPADPALAEFNANWGLAAINADDAYGAGATGNGVLVGVVDDGIDSDFSEFTGRIAAGGQNFITGRTAGNIEGDATYNTHGTHVSGIIAANRNSSGMHGVAYEAQILPLRIFETTASFGYVADYNDIAAAYDYGITQGVQVFNGSYGYSAVIDVAAQEAEFDAYERAVTAGAILVFANGNDSWTDPAFPALTPYIKPANDAAAAAASFYINNTNAKDYSALASQLIAVASVDENGVISSFSNRCGVAADWCISAPGGQIYSTVPEHTYDTYDGTSMAAPHVAGAVALLIDKYPALTPAQVVTRLLTSANKTGIYADTSVYGQGMLDLSTATSFMARPLVLTGSTLSGPSFDLTQSRIRLGSAFGDGLTRSLSQRDVTIVDSFDGANFEMKGDVLTEAGDLSNRMEDGIRRFGAETHTLELNDGGDTIVSWRSVPGGTSGERDKTETRVTTHFSENTSVSAGYMADPSLGFGLMAEGTLNDGESRSKGAFLSPYLGLVSDGMSFAAQSKFGDFTVRAASFTGNAEDEDDQSGYGAATELAYTPFRGGSLALQAGFVSEEDTFLGSESGGAFALGQSDTTYAGVSGSLSIMPKTELVGSYFLGMSNVDAAPGSLFTSLGNIQSDAFSLGLIQHDTAVQDDRLGFLLNQPLRVSSGSASLRLPTNLNREHDVSYSLTNAGLTPTGREMDVEAFYAAPVDEHTNVNASVMYRHQPDHIATAPDEAQMLLHVNHKY